MPNTIQSHGVLPLSAVRGKRWGGRAAATGLGAGTGVAAGAAGAACWSAGAATAGAGLTKPRCCTVALFGWTSTITLPCEGVPCSPYLTVTEALQDPQVEHRGSLCTIEDSGGSYKSPAPPFRFSGSPLQSGPKVASLGADTKSVLAEAGLSASEIEALLK